MEAFEKVISKNHTEGIQQNFVNDVTFKIGMDENVRTFEMNSTILAMQSRELHKLIFDDNGVVRKTIRLPNIDPRAFEIIFNAFSYRPIVLSDDIIAPLIYLGNMYLITHLLDLCKEYLIKLRRRNETKVRYYRLIHDLWVIHAKKEVRAWCPDIMKGPNGIN